MNYRRDLLLIGALVALIGVAALLTPTGDDQIAGRPTTFSSSPAGALGLLRWLDQVGYRADRLAYEPFALRPSDDVLFVLEPISPFSPAQIDDLLAWIDAGGTLIYASEQGNLFGGNALLLGELGVEFRFIDGEEGALRDAPSLIPLTNPPLATLRVETNRRLISEAEGFVPLFGSEEAVVIAALPRGAGMVYFASTTRPFSNQGLRDPNSGALVLNLLERAGRGAQIRFDEIHHGFVSEPSLRDFVLGSVWGRSLIFAALVGAAYLIWSGRRFGRPIPLLEEVRRRSSAEYVEQIGDLLQRGGKREHIARHYRTLLKRRLAKPYGLNPTLDDRQFVEELAAQRPLERGELTTILAELAAGPRDDGHLLRLIASADAISERPTE